MAMIKTFFLILLGLITNYTYSILVEIPQDVCYTINKQGKIFMAYTYMENADKVLSISQRNKTGGKIWEKKAKISNDNVIIRFLVNENKCFVALSNNINLTNIYHTSNKSKEDIQVSCIPIKSMNMILMSDNKVAILATKNLEKQVKYGTDTENITETMLLLLDNKMNILWNKTLVYHSGFYSTNILGLKHLQVVDYEGKEGISVVLEHNIMQDSLSNLEYVNGDFQSFVVQSYMLLNISGNIEYCFTKGDIPSSQVLVFANGDIAEMGIYQPYIESKPQRFLLLTNYKGDTLKLDTISADYEPYATELFMGNKHSIWCQTLHSNLYFYRITKQNFIRHEVNQYKDWELVDTYTDGFNKFTLLLFNKTDFEDIIEFKILKVKK